MNADTYRDIFLKHVEDGMTYREAMAIPVHESGFQRDEKDRLTDDQNQRPKRTMKDLDLIIMVACPYCGAAIEQKCRSSSSSRDGKPKEQRVFRPHIRRVRKFEEMSKNPAFMALARASA